ncbi:MAG: malectin domain-containing carbohydrate-binding protein [Verrucomicrobiota bacterium]
MIKTLSSVALTLGLVCHATYADTQRQLLPRLVPVNNTQQVFESEEAYLVIKVNNDAHVATNDLYSYCPQLTALALSHGFVLESLIKVDPERLQALGERGEARTGKEQTKLNTFFRGEFVEQPAIETLQLIAAAIDELETVEYCHIAYKTLIPPGAVTSDTPDLTEYQTYRNGEAGVNIDYAWDFGAGGWGVRLSDVEFYWNLDHEDIIDAGIQQEPNQTPHPLTLQFVPHHGLGVVGITSAVPNEFGMTGLVPDAEVWVYPEFTIEGGIRRFDAVATAIADSRPGDVVMLEMQTPGLTDDPAGFAPAELELPLWEIIRAGTDAGVIIVAVAGNGNQDLDSPLYAPYMARGDSGAIMVGAGTPDTEHNRLFFSNYGTRVNAQGWGWDVATLGEGDFMIFEGDENRAYTNTFNGTSSATPFVAAACVSLQSLAQEELGRRLSPAEMRDLITTTGTPQGDGLHIGPFINMKSSIDELLSRNWVTAINCGGEEFISASGIVYAEDTDFDGGSTIQVLDDIADTPDDAVFASARQGEFEYEIEVPKGEYELVLHFAEIAGSPTSSVTVTAEGDTIAENLNIADEAGGALTALTLSETIVIRDKELDLEVSGLGASLSGFYLRPVSEIVVAVNCGGSNYRSRKGITFSTDKFYSGGNSFETTDRIKETVDQPTHQTARQGEFSYNVPVENGSYAVVAQFAAIDETLLETDSMTLTIEGDPVLADFSVIDSANGTDRAYRTVLPATVTDGVLSLKIESTSGNGQLNAFYISELAEVTVAVNSGGSYLIDDDILYFPDFGYTGGSTFGLPARFLGLFLNSSGRQGDFSYSVDVPDGDYVLTLNLANANGHFDLTVEGDAVPLARRARGARSFGADREIEVPVTIEDGNIDFQLESTRRSGAKLNSWKLVAFNSSDRS